MTFELHVAPGLRKDIRSKRQHDAADRFVTAVQALAATVFSWAERIVVKKEFSYLWWENTEEIKLPPTSENTVI